MSRREAAAVSVIGGEGDLFDPVDYGPLGGDPLGARRVAVDQIEVGRFRFFGIEGREDGFAGGAFAQPGDGHRLSLRDAGLVVFSLQVVYEVGRLDGGGRNRPPLSGVK